MCQGGCLSPSRNCDHPGTPHASRSLGDWSDDVSAMRLRVETDPVQFQHVLANLALNAQEALPEGVTVRVSPSRRPPDAVGIHDWIELTRFAIREGLLEP
jgi:signal transduction histidine kinase